LCIFSVSVWKPPCSGNGFYFYFRWSGCDKIAVHLKLKMGSDFFKQCAFYVKKNRVMNKFQEFEVLKSPIFWDITRCSPSTDYMALYPRR
jgi:hypothetical protein